MKPEDMRTPTRQVDDSASVSANALLADHMIVESEVEVEHGAVFVPTDPDAPTILRAQSRIGAGAVIGAGVEIGLNARVLPGTVVTSSIPANSVAAGNPARIVGYTDELRASATVTGRTPLPPAPPGNRRSVEIVPLGVDTAAIYYMPKVLDIRGNLTVGEIERDLPFQPKRYFAIFDVPTEKLRGEHAHLACEQFLICLNGSCTALVDNGVDRREVVLDSPDIALYMPAMIWGTQYKYSPDSILLVLASHEYDPGDYIREYDTFREIKARS